MENQRSPFKNWFPSFGIGHVDVGGIAPKLFGRQAFLQRLSLSQIVEGGTELVPCSLCWLAADLQSRSFGSAGFAQILQPSHQDILQGLQDSLQKPRRPGFFAAAAKRPAVFRKSHSSR